MRQKYLHCPFLYEFLEYAILRMMIIISSIYDIIFQIAGVDQRG